jgi:hypothetical protein
VDDTEETRFGKEKAASRDLAMAVLGMFFYSIFYLGRPGG